MESLPRALLLPAAMELNMDLVSSSPAASAHDEAALCETSSCVRQVSFQHAFMAMDLFKTGCVAILCRTIKISALRRGPSVSTRTSKSVPDGCKLSLPHVPRQGFVRFLQTQGMISLLKLCGCCSLAARPHSSSWCSKSGQSTKCSSWLVTVTNSSNTST